MIYILITTSLIEDNFNERKKEYIMGISTLLMYSKEIFINKKIDYKFIIIENNNKKNSFLEEFSNYCHIYYTNNNSINTPNKGIKEIKDIHDCINHYNIKDDDFIIKMTGRYILQYNSDFLNVFKNFNDNIDCIVKYGSFMNDNDYNKDDCITGLIGLRCKYVKQIEIPDDKTCIEHNYAKIIKTISNENIISLEKLDILIKPIIFIKYKLV